jgi:hypothetical protein
MPRIPARVAARIDRLSRAAHRFHRFAHHPLCDEYGGELVRLSRRARLCRGCLFAGAGGFAGLAASVLLPAPFSVLVCLGGAGVLGLVNSTISRRSPRQARAPKLVSRFLPAAVIAYALGRAVQLGPSGRVLAATFVLLLLAVIALYRRRGPDRTPCASCAERNLPTPCRGIAPIVRRERAFRRLAGQWMARVGP